jgi:hypothetical protein
MRVSLALIFLRLKEARPSSTMIDEGRAVSVLTFAFCLTLLLGA